MVNNRVLGGDIYGARRFTSLRELTSDQSSAARAILSLIHEIGVRNSIQRDIREQREREAAYKEERADNEYWPPTDQTRPSHVVVIDGSRGTGKTTLLLTLRHFVSQMRLSGNFNLNTPSPDTIDQQLDEVLGAQRANVDRSTRVALTMPVVFPDSLESGETTMEALFALIENSLEQRREQLRKGALGDGDLDAKRARIDALIRELHDDVSVAWTFSRGIGVKALKADALNYDDFVTRRAQHNRLAYTRIDRWRHFVDRLLDALDYELLVPFFDDTDLLPRAGVDILHAIRIYLDHPRIVTVLAVNMDSLHRVLAMEAYKLFDESLRAMARAKQLLPSDKIAGWESRVEHIEMDVSAHIAKVLPAPLQHRLAFSDAKDFDRIFGASFAAFCLDKMAATLGSNNIGALSWWLLQRSPYIRLPTYSVRDLLSFRDFVNSNTKNGISLSPAKILFASAPARRLYERVDGAIDGVLYQLTIRALKPRKTRSASQSFDEDGYHDRFLDFWIDSNLAAGTIKVEELNRMDSVIPGWKRNELSKQLAARNSAEFGVASCFNDTAFPKNALYLVDLYPLIGYANRTLPDFPIPKWHAQLTSAVLAPNSLPTIIDQSVSLKEAKRNGIGRLGASLANAIDSLKDGSRDASRNATCNMFFVWRLYSDLTIDGALASVEESDRDKFGQFWDVFQRLWLQADVDRIAAVRIVELAARVAGTLFSESDYLPADPCALMSVIAERLGRTKEFQVRDSLLLAWALLPPMEHFITYRLTPPTDANPGVEACEILVNVLGDVVRNADALNVTDGPSRFDPKFRRHLFPDLEERGVVAILAEVRSGSATLGETLQRRKALSRLSITKANGRQMAAATLGVGEGWLDGLEIGDSAFGNRT